MELNNCCAYKRTEQRTNILISRYIFNISLDLTNINILNYLIQIKPGTCNNDYITFKYLDLDRSVEGFILDYDINKNTITLQRESARRSKSMVNNGIEVFNISMIRDCKLEYIINHFTTTNLKSDEYDYNKRHYKSNDTEIINNKKKYIKQPNNDNIDFID